MLFPKPVKRPKRRGHSDPVRPDVRAGVLRRDGGCVAAIIDREHECRDAFGTPHRWDDLDRLTMEHVKARPRMGVRATSDPRHMVAMCHAGNLYWGPVHRDEERGYLGKFGGAK